MTDIGDEITRLAQSYDPDKEADSKLSRALVHGFLMGSLFQQNSSNPERTVRVETIQQERDQDGNYLPFFYALMESGAKIKVTVEVEQ